MMASRKAVLDKNKQQLLDSVNASNKIYNNEELSILLAEQREKIDALEQKQNNVLNKTYPVGSIYISYNSTNPSSLFGGTWISYATGRTLVGVDTSQTEFNSVGKAGGAGTHAHGEMGQNGTLSAAIGSAYQDAASLNFIASGFYSGSNIKEYGTYMIHGNNMDYTSGLAFSHFTQVWGTTAPASNLPPYITVYMWRRTA